MKTMLSWGALFLLPILCVALGISTAAAPHHAIDVASLSLGAVLFAGVLKTGTLGISDLLAATTSTAAEIGIDVVAETLNRDLAAHNAIVDELIAELCEPTTARLGAQTGSINGQMSKVDEFGASPTQKTAAGQTLGFPLEMFQYAIGWTEMWMKLHTVSEMATQQLAAKRAHLTALALEIKRALFRSSNYTFLDYNVDNVSLAVKRLLNADSVAIPEGPNGETFTASTHTHYNSNATLTAAALQANTDDVTEHGFGSSPRIYISTTDEAAVRALTGFQAYLDPRLSFGAAANQPTKRLDITRMDNRAIGIFGSAEVWVKPWMIASYHFAFDFDGPKPLKYRQREQGELRGLRIAAEQSAFPLTAKWQQADFGFGVWTRANGAVLYSANATYADPTAIAG